MATYLGDDLLGGVSAQKGLETIGAGAGAGAAIGSAVPILGTAIGAGIGAGVGAVAAYGKEWGGKLKKLFKKKKKKKSGGGSVNPPIVLSAPAAPAAPAVPASPAVPSFYTSPYGVLPTVPKQSNAPIIAGVTAGVLLIAMVALRS